MANIGNDKVTAVVLVQNKAPSSVSSNLIRNTHEVMKLNEPNDIKMTSRGQDYKTSVEYESSLYCSHIKKLYLEKVATSNQITYSKQGKRKRFSPIDITLIPLGLQHASA